MYIKLPPEKQNLKVSGLAKMGGREVEGMRGMTQGSCKNCTKEIDIVDMDFSGVGTFLCTQY